MLYFTTVYALFVFDRNCFNLLIFHLFRVYSCRNRKFCLYTFWPLPELRVHLEGVDLLGCLLNKTGDTDGRNKSATFNQKQCFNNLTGKYNNIKCTLSSVKPVSEMLRSETHYMAMHRNNKEIKNRCAFLMERRSKLLQKLSLVSLMKLTRN